MICKMGIKQINDIKSMYVVFLRSWNLSDVSLFIYAKVFNTYVYSVCTINILLQKKKNKIINEMEHHSKDGFNLNASSTLWLEHSKNWKLKFSWFWLEFVTKSRKAQASSFKIANVKTVYQKNKALMNFRIFKTRQSLAL